MTAAGVPQGDRAFTGAIPELYDSLLVPLLFAPYAEDLATRLRARQPARLLELAAGTGAVTRRLAATLPPSTAIVATDLNPAMLEQAAKTGTPRPVEWRPADAQALPFDDGSFDAVVCQFGVMFFPDKAKAYAEARRVLRAGGRFLFNVWDRIEANEVGLVVQGAMEALFPGDPPTFLPRAPYGYHDHARIVADLVAGGFAMAPRIATVTARGRSESARSAALGYVQGSPLRNEIEARDPSLLSRATEMAGAALAARFGTGPIDTQMQAVVIDVDR